MAHEFWINEQKGREGRTHGYLEKSDGCIYLTEEEAQIAINADPQLARFRSTQRMVADTYALWMEDNELVRAYLALPQWLRTLAKYLAGIMQ